MDVRVLWLATLAAGVATPSGPVDGGYGVVLRFDADVEASPTVGDCGRVVANAESALRLLSHALFAISQRRLYIRDVDVTVPASWPNCPSASETSDEITEESDADFVVFDVGGRTAAAVAPWTRSDTECDASGHFIGLSLNYLRYFPEDDATYIESLVHQWLKYRYAVGNDTTAVCSRDTALFYRRMLGHHHFGEARSKTTLPETNFHLVAYRPHLPAVDRMWSQVQIRPGDGQRRYRLTLSLRWDAAGWPVVGAAVTASIRHDADDRQTLVIRLNDDRDGNYSAVLTDRFGPGPYRLSLRATGPAHVLIAGVRCCGVATATAAVRRRVTVPFLLTHGETTYVFDATQATTPFSSTGSSSSAGSSSTLDSSSISSSSPSAVGSFSSTTDFSSTNSSSSSSADRLRAAWFVVAAVVFHFPFRVDSLRFSTFGNE